MERRLERTGAEVSGPLSRAPQKPHSAVRLMSPAAWPPDRSRPSGARRRERRQHERPSGRGCPAPGSRHRDI